MTTDQQRPAAERGGAAQVAGLRSQLLCRVRPCDRPSPLVLICEAEAKVEVAPEKGHPGEPLLFHQVLTQSQAQSPSEQEALFQSVRPAIIGASEGQSSTIVAYGGPQSGKTYALSGFFTHDQLHGLVPRAIKVIVGSVEKSPVNAPVIEASFFELGQDVVYDLVPPSLPKVVMQELPRVPYVKMDDKLTAIRCDGQAGQPYNRLLDTYFTGLEHRRKGTHTCFQITFVHEDRSAPGRPAVRSYLRFIEMAWPRSLNSVSAPSGGHSSLGGSAASKSKASLAQDRTVASLDQVLQCKLTGSGSPPYKCSPLVLLLKPCFEGASLLTFIYCMRLEHSHLCSLALAAPLLSKLHTWLNRATGVREEALAAMMSRSGLSSAPIVPPLQLQTGGSVSAPAGQPAFGADVSAEMSSCCTSECVSPEAGDSSITLPRLADADAGAGAHETSTFSQAEQLALLEKLADQPAIDSDKMMRDLALLLEVKQRSTQMLQADAERSAVVLENLSAVLARFRVKREACQEHGPCEKETNLRLLFEKVSRSLQRSQIEIAKMYEDIEVIAQFCQGGAVAQAYESYGVTEEDVQKVMDHMLVEVGPPRLAGASATAPAGAQPQPQHADNVVIIPQLPLSLLAQEAVDIPQQSNMLSPSSASSCSELETSTNTISRQGLSVCVDVGRSPVLVARSVNYVQNAMIALPQTPPVPSRMVLGLPQQHSLQQSVWPTAAQFASHPGQQLSLGHVFQVAQNECNTSQHGNSVSVPATDQPSQTPSYGGYEVQANRSISAQPGYPGLSGAFQVQVQVTSQDDDLQSRLRKSRSTNALMGRSLSTTAMGAVALSGAGSGPPPVRAPVGSPLLGHRSTLSSVSPLRGSLTSMGQSATAPAHSGMGQSASTSALPGSASANMVVPKRSAMHSSSAARGPQRPHGTIMSHASAGGELQPPHAPLVAVRQTTPMSHNQEVRSRGSGGSAAQAHSPSPAMMRRSVSTQALRFDRPVAGGSKPSHEKAMARGHAPGGPSPERQRPIAVASGAVPARAMSPGVVRAQR